jgi:hypothetical protein
LTSGLLFQGGGKFSVSAALFDVADPQAWQERSGLAPWLAYAIDTVTRLNAPVETTTPILEAIGLGAATENVGSAVIEAALSSVECEHPGLADARALLQKLHARAASGDAPSNADWRAARKLATEVTDSVSSDLDKRIATCIEAAAWSPVQAPTSVAEVLRAWGQKANVDAQLGWDASRHATTRAKLGALHDRFIKNNPGEERTVFDFLEEDDPMMASDIRTYISTQGRAATEQIEKARELLIEVLSAAK